jgi:hypothetical protein
MLLPEPLELSQQRTIQQSKPRKIQSHCRHQQNINAANTLLLLSMLPAALHGHSQQGQNCGGNWLAQSP